MRTKKIFALCVGLAVAGAFSTPVSAQLPNASAATLGLAGNQTAIARGFAAISVNPAGLAMPGSGFSLALIPVQVRAGIDPITLSDLVDVQGEVIDLATRQDWVNRIDAAGGQSGSVGLNLSELALTMGSIGIQLSTVVSADMRLGPGVVETVLFGNADPTTGAARDITLQGSAFDAYAISTAALSIGKSLPSLTGDMAIGATLKYTVGHGIASATADGAATSSPIGISLDVPMVHTNDDNYQFNNGSGVGLDLGFQMQQGPLHLGAALQNLFNTFAWDPSTLVYRPGTASFSATANTTDFDPISYDSAPADLKANIEGMKFKPALAVGGAFDLPMRLTVTGDLRQRLGDGLALGPKFNMGVGAEWKGLRIIHLRAGASKVTGGLQYGAGASLVLGPLNLTAGVATITGENADTGLAQFAFSLGNR